MIKAIRPYRGFSFKNEKGGAYQIACRFDKSTMKNLNAFAKKANITVAETIRRTVRYAQKHNKISSN